MTTTSDPKLESLRFPIGRFKVPETISAAERAQFIEEVAAAPAAMRAAVKGLSAAGSLPAVSATASATWRRHSFPWQGPVPKPV